jgi:allophanate hydrolase subunit 1
MTEPLFFPKTVKEWLRGIALETAKMYWSPRLSSILIKGARRVIEEKYFTDLNNFPIVELWENGKEISKIFDTWHKKRIEEINDIVGSFKRQNNYTKDAISAKLLNTYIHQLMKYQKLQVNLFNVIHLPLDNVVFQELNRLKDSLQVLNNINDIIKNGAKCAYQITYDEYLTTQNELWKVVNEINNRPGMEYKIESRIELNYLWAMRTDKNLKC